MSLSAASQATLNILVPVQNHANDLVTMTQGYITSAQGTGAPTAIAEMQAVLDALVIPLANLAIAVKVLTDAQAQG